MRWLRYFQFTHSHSRCASVCCHRALLRALSKYYLNICNQFMCCHFVSIHLIQLCACLSIRCSVWLMCDSVYLILADVSGSADSYHNGQRNEFPWAERIEVKSRISVLEDHQTRCPLVAPRARGHETIRAAFTTYSTYCNEHYIRFISLRFH